MKQRQPDSVNNRRPQPLEAIGCSGQRKQPDSRQRHTGILEPQAKRAKHQQIGKPAGKPEQNHRQHSAVKINLGGIYPFLKHTYSRALPTAIPQEP